jgi:hypothetical protein
VTQKKDIKRQKQRLDALKREHEEEQARAKAAARERVLQEFEKGQLGLGRSSLSISSGTDSKDGMSLFANLFSCWAELSKAGERSGSSISTHPPLTPSHAKLRRQHYAKSNGNKRKLSELSFRTSGYPPLLRHTLHPVLRGRLRRSRSRQHAGAVSLHMALREG